MPTSTGISQMSRRRLKRITATTLPDERGLPPAHLAGEHLELREPRLHLGRLRPESEAHVVVELVAVANARHEVRPPGLVDEGAAQVPRRHRQLETRERAERPA